MENTDFYTTTVQLGDKLEEEQLANFTKDDFPRRRIGHTNEQNRTTSGEVSRFNSENEEVIDSSIIASQSLPQRSGVYVSNHPNGSMGSMTHENIPKFLSETVGWTIDDSSPSTGSDHISRQYGGMGSTLAEPGSPRSLAILITRYRLQHTGTQGRLTSR